MIPGARAAIAAGGAGRNLLKVALCVAFIAAPTAGDIGSCGQELAELDPQKFFLEKLAIDCRQCQSCELSSVTCERACSLEGLNELDFEPNCFPLVHDGEVCLNALRAAGCDEYAAYVDDVAPETPTECNFCPIDQRPEE